jgi:glycosyltransferase involved in cell wall biosynthesis
MKIGIVCFAWGKDHRGGLETHVSGLAKLLSEYGHQVFIHCINEKGTDNQYNAKGWKEGSLQIDQTNYNYSDTRCLFDFQRVPQAEIILRDWINHNQLDIIDFHHNLFFGIRAVRSCSKLVPTVVTLHDYWCIDPQCSLFDSEHSIIGPDDHDKWEQNSLKSSDQTLKSLESADYYTQIATIKDKNTPRISLKSAWARYSNQMLQYASAIITPSKETASILHQHGMNQKISVVENGLNLSFPRGQLANEISDTSTGEPPGERIRIGILGNVAPHKGQLRFCEALLEGKLQKWLKVELHGPIPDTYQGDQSSQKRIIEIANNYPNLLKLNGPYDKEDLSSIFSQLDVVAMPSLWQEVYGFVAREALAYGLPIIITDAGGLAGLSGHEGVFTLPMAHPEHWGKSLREGLEEGPFFRWTYQRRKGIPMPSDFIPSNQDCARKIENLYQRLIADHSKQFDNSTKPIPGSRPST